MSRKNSSKRPAGRRRMTGLPLLVAVVVFGALGTLPLTFKALNLHIRPIAPATSYGVRLLPAPGAPRPLLLPPVAKPVDPGQPPASAALGNVSTDAALVSSEDSRVRILLHDAVRIYQPEVLPTRGSLPTLVLTAGSHPYGIADLAQYGALVLLRHHAALLVDNIFVSTNATLIIRSPLQALYLDSSPSGFASIVAWNGNLKFEGTAARPLTIMGWDRLTKSAATDKGYGRSYIREVGGQMTLVDVRVSSLGFWSGRTGGVSWTGISKQASTGGADDSTFTDDTYGAFVSRGTNLKFANDLFEFNQLDGIHIHRFSTGTTVTRSSASRNGASGFLIDQATQNTLLRYDLAQHNAGNGFMINGRPLTNGASASGNAVLSAAGTTIEDSAALANGKSGILVEGSTGTVLKANDVCTGQTGIAARLGATNTVITGNDVRCKPRSGLSIGPIAPGAVVSGNSVSGPRIGVLIRSSGSISVDANLITGATVFGITARGATSAVNGVGNVISGTGFRAVDARADAHQPALSGTKTTGWAHHLRINFWSYLLFHPLAALWLGILVLVLLCYLWSRRRRLAPHPYPASTHWRLPEPMAGAGQRPALALSGALASAGPAGLGAGRLHAGPGLAVPAMAGDLERVVVGATAGTTSTTAEYMERLSPAGGQPSAPDWLAKFDSASWQGRPVPARHSAPPADFERWQPESTESPPQEQDDWDSADPRLPKLAEAELSPPPDRPDQDFFASARRLEPSHPGERERLTADPRREPERLTADSPRERERLTADPRRERERLTADSPRERERLQPAQPGLREGLQTGMPSSPERREHDLLRQPERPVLDLAAKVERLSRVLPRMAEPPEPQAHRQRPSSFWERSVPATEPAEEMPPVADGQGSAMSTDGNRAGRRHELTESSVPQAAANDWPDDDPGHATRPMPRVAD
jgi:hypothetical protein